MSYAWAATERCYRRAARKADLNETQLRLLDVVIFYSVGRQRLKALLPKQRFFGLLCGLDEGDVSRGLDELEGLRVIERNGAEYALLPPPWLAVNSRVVESRELLELERWLEELDDRQLDLMSAPPSLADAMRENFVEESSRVESAKASSRLSTESIEVGQKPTGGPVRDLVRSRPAAPGVGKDPNARLGANPNPSSGVGNSPTVAVVSSTRVLENSRVPTQLENRVLGSREGASGGSRKPADLDYQAYVERRLFETIGERERRDRCGLMWMRAVKEMPSELDELLSHALMLKSTTQPNLNVAGWLNRSVYRALQVTR